jgi:hypothetical protein
MDDVEVLTATLNSTLQRHSRLAQNYEIEIANMTAEILRLKSQVEELEALKNNNTTLEGK